MSVSKNDNQILKLKKQVDEKKAALNKAQRFSPITNCSLEIDGARANIQVLGKNDLVLALVKLNAYRKSADELGVLDQLIVSGYPVGDWITDLKAKLAYLNRKQEEDKLKLMENKLLQLLSNEKQVELELGDLAKELSGM